ncbi:hypothetical protein BS47DRAFT_1326947 [Hydnum rufescens UP504]|uniref:(2E,6E)-farnesyl diphosphate synthase n=1 Tax=Hydnum rufescens UP504 TaxID=1448309 RepID=A0A9P6B657_9AGAM|nr:hypothetical protein BS47DRAFT_1326947 [Hydnum rufescens UP504]
MPEDVVKWFQANLQYNVPGGKLNRGLSVVDTVEIILRRPLEEEEYKRAAILGWCVEMMQGLFLVADDMMDHSLTRRGQPCWYQVVGMVAVNDTGCIEAAIYFLLRKYFRSEPWYIDVVEHFLETTFKTCMGQMVDLMTAPEDRLDISQFSLERHRITVIYKTSWYSFYLPVACAARFCGIVDPSTYSLAQSILLPLGEYFQVQDDFLDAYAHPDVLGKIGTDIRDNKNTWLINKALEICSPDQRALLEANYGRKDPEAEARVKAVYDSLDLPERYREYERRAHAHIVGLVNGIPNTGELRPEVFMAFLRKIFGRTM